MVNSEAFKTSASTVSEKVMFIAPESRSRVYDVIVGGVESGIRSIALVALLDGTGIRLFLFMS